MKVAVSIGKLRIPPTYFAVQHTLRLMARHRLRTIALSTTISDPVIASSGLDIVEAMPRALQSVKAREAALVLATPRAARLIEAFEPDVIHQHFSNWTLPATRAARSTGAGLITTLHGGDVFAARRSTSSVPVAARPLLAWHHSNFRGAVRQSHRFLAVSSYLAAEAVAAGVPADRLEVHYQGIDTDYFTPGTRPDELPTVLFVGALSTLKGVVDLVEASVAVAPRHPHRLVIVGAGPLRSALEQQAATHPHIELRGRLSQTEVRDALRAATMLVLPTQVTAGVREAAGLVLLEAQACGTPVVAYASGGTPEMLVDGETGVLVAEKDRAALAEAIASILRLPSVELAAMGSRARDFVVGERSLDRSVLELEQHYTDVAAR